MHIDEPLNSIIKQGYAKGNMLRELTSEEVQSQLASPEIVSRLEKHARRVQALAPKSDDFLYFTIIFLKAAESSIIDEFGENKKVGSEKAWGYFDEKWVWHGNVKPHKNNNGDIFPELELKQATRKWIGMPLCVDHKSDSVDGVRGIILDTYYDEKLKQVVGLCALDKVNYPDLARKVSTGVVRYGSMGTAVETAICTECAKPARTPKEYCEHIIQRVAWGEINVGLKPIEYSLVVQPAEPAAKLLRCIATIKSHQSELKNYGVDNVDDLVENLTIKQASELDRILTAVCGEGGCSIRARKGVVTSYLEHNGFVKSAALNDAQEEQVQFAEALAEIKAATGKSPDDAINGDEDAYELYAPIYDAFGRRLPTIDGGNNAPAGESITSDELLENETAKTIVAPGTGIDRDLTGAGGNTSLTSGITEPSESFEDTGVPLMKDNPNAAFASNSELNFDSIIGEIMKESRKLKRAELRRRLAYHQGGADGVEPNTYKSDPMNENLRNKGDKQMHENPANLGGTDGMVPGDKEVKEKLSRAEEIQDKMEKRLAYHQGGSAPDVEPKGTYTSESYQKYWTPGKDADKHLNLNPENTGGTDGMFPGDKETKEKLSRASYDGPPLSTKLTQLRKLDGSINKAASKFEVFAGDELVIATTAGDIWGPKLADEWDYLASKEYGKNVVAEIRDHGIKAVAELLTKTAAPPELPMEEPMAEEPMDEMPMDEAPMDEMPMDEAPMEDEEPESDPRAKLDEIFLTIEEKIEEARDTVEQLGGEAGADVDLTFNVGDEGAVETEPEELLLAKMILTNLKTVYAELNESADEIALLAQTHENYKKFSSKQKKEFATISDDAIQDSAELIGETNVLLSMAKAVSTATSMKKVSTYSEEVDGKVTASNETVTADETDTLVAEAMAFRKQRREEMLRLAMEKVEGDDEVESDAADATVSDAADATVSDEADATVSDEADMESPADDQLGKHYMENSAKSPDTSDVKEIAEDEAKEEVDEHEDDMHSDAQDAPVSAVQAKLSDSFLAKKSGEEREAYRLKLRRAYDIAMMMQDKNLLHKTKAALEGQVDEIMLFKDESFEAFKRTIANAKKAETVKVANDISGINIGVEEDLTDATKTTVQILESMWD